MYLYQKKTLIFSRHDISDLSDEELLRRSRSIAGAEYFGMLFGRYIPLLYGVCLKYLRQPDRAEDAVMAIFGQLQPRIARYEIAEFRTWIYSVAKNHCLQQLRRSERERATQIEDRFVESAGVAHLWEEDDDSPRHRALRACMEKLPGPQRESLKRFFEEELSYADIAAQTGWSLKSVKSYIQNGKRNLKICIENAIAK